MSIMTTVGVRELKQNASAVLALVESGETVDVTVRGRLVGRLVPVTASADPLARLRAEGLVVTPTGNLSELGIPIGEIDRDARVSRALEEMRNDERA
jgi:prevent-host-death family protein